uniref:Uncharacterized protein n=1 Tax=Avena sativa TaxID=4498 RepID=A0ACD6AH62_AVESA
MCRRPKAIINITLNTDQPDQLIWKWNSNGTYSASSCYLAPFQGSVRCNAWKLYGKPGHHHASNSSIWLANKNRCWMADRLHIRLQHLLAVLCDQEPEKMHHLPLLKTSLARDRGLD